MAQQELSLLEKALLDEKSDCAIIEPKDPFPYERLLVYLGNDRKFRERVLEITIKEQLFPQKVETNEVEYLSIQFKLMFPFEIKDIASQQVAHLLHFLNHFLELPGLEMSEAEGKIFYRYVLLCGKKAFDPQLCLSIIGNILLMLELFSQSIEVVALGEKNFNDLLHDVLDLASQISSV